MKAKSTHGGARKGAGRKTGKETVTLSFRVPLDKAETLREKIRKIIIQNRDIR